MELSWWNHQNCIRECCFYYLGSLSALVLLLRLLLFALLLTAPRSLLLCLLCWLFCALLCSCSLRRPLLLCLAFRLLLSGIYFLVLSSLSLVLCDASPHALLFLSRFSLRTSIIRDFWLVLSPPRHLLSSHEFCSSSTSSTIGFVNVSTVCSKSGSASAYLSMFR